MLLITFLHAFTIPGAPCNLVFISDIILTFFFYFFSEFNKHISSFFPLFDPFLFLVFKFLIQTFFIITKCCLRIWNSTWRTVLWLSILWSLFKWDFSPTFRLQIHSYLFIVYVDMFCFSLLLFILWTGLSVWEHPLLTVSFFCSFIFGQHCWKEWLICIFPLLLQDP